MFQIRNNSILVFNICIFLFLERINKIECKDKKKWKKIKKEKQKAIHGKEFHEIPRFALTWWWLFCYRVSSNQNANNNNINPTIFPPPRLWIKTNNALISDLNQQQHQSTDAQQIPTTKSIKRPSKWAAKRLRYPPDLLLVL